MLTAAPHCADRMPCHRVLVAALVLVFALPVTIPNAQAQILKKLKKRVEERVERRAEQEADKAVDRAADRVVGGAAERAGNAAGNAIGNAAGLPAGAMGGGSIEGLADFRELQALLPASFAGLQQTDLTGEATATMGMSVSSASAEYGSDDRFATLGITDTGSLRAFLTMSAAWMGMTVNQETATGYTRTFTLGGYPAYIQEDREGGLESSVQVVISDRLLVSASARGISADDLRASVERLDFAALETMAAELAELSIPLVPFDELIGFLPSNLSGFTRATPTGESGGVAGLEMSQADVVFTRGDEHVTVTILDLGSLSGATALSYAAWLSVPINKQSTEGFARTLKLGAHPAYEEQNNGPDGTVSSQVQVAPGRRFLVTAEGNVPADVARAAAEAVDLDALARRAETPAND